MNDKENLKVAVIESCINGTMTIKVAANNQHHCICLSAAIQKYLCFLSTP